MNKVDLGDIGSIVRHEDGSIFVETHHGFSRQLRNPEIERIISLLTAKPDEVNMTTDETALRYCSLRANRKGVYDPYRYNALLKVISGKPTWESVFITATICDTIYTGIKHWQLPLYLLKAAFTDNLPQCDRFINVYHTEANLKKFFRMSYFSQYDACNLDIDTSWLDVPIVIVTVNGKMKLDLLNPVTISYLNNHVFHKHTLATHLLTPTSP